MLSLMRTKREAELLQAARSASAHSLPGTWYSAGICPVDSRFPNAGRALLGGTFFSRSPACEEAARVSPRRPSSFPGLASKPPRNRSKTITVVCSITHGCVVAQATSCRRSQPWAAIDERGSCAPCRSLTARRQRWGASSPGPPSIFQRRRMVRQPAVNRSLRRFTARLRRFVDVTGLRPLRGLRPVPFDSFRWSPLLVPAAPGTGLRMMHWGSRWSTTWL